MTTRIKHREIQFEAIHADANQAQSAMLVLADLVGIEKLVAEAPCRILVSYDFTQITLNKILQELQNEGLHLYNSLLSKLKQALYSYTEETQRANLGISQTSSSTTRDIFMSQHKRRPHGCRDQRPHHWRNYL